MRVVDLLMPVVDVLWIFIVMFPLFVFSVSLNKFILSAFDVLVLWTAEFCAIG